MRLDAGVERVMGVFVLTTGPLAEVARSELESTPSDGTRTVVDLDRAALLGVANPPRALFAEENGTLRPLSMDEARRCLAPHSVATVGTAALKSRRMRQGESVAYDADFEPPGWPPFRMVMVARPLALDTSGRAYLTVNDVRLEPLG